MPSERITAKLLIVDAGPLITLAAAASLDYLLYANGAVVIPDAVFFEATRDASRLGASIIVEWVNANLDRVHIAPTNAFAAFTRDYQAGEQERRLDLGEQAAVEYARHHIHLAMDERAVLLSEDRKVTGLRLAREEASRAIIITMRDFLLTLEQIGRINSVDAVYDAAVEAGRTPSRRELLDQHEPMLRDAVARLLGRAEPIGDNEPQA
ncbi:MAG TPA: hypothetical protein VGI78_15765 [Acetobacteraceae bacterium]|jgi:predicted nucleic acid-binding protein